MRTCGKRHPFENGDPVLSELVNLVGVAGEKSHFMKPEVVEDRSRGKVVTVIRGEAECEVRTKGVQTGFLQPVGPEFVGESDAAALVSTHVNHNTTLPIDCAEGGVEVWAAFTFLGFQRLAAQTFEVHTNEETVGWCAGHLAANLW